MTDRVVIDEFHLTFTVPRDIGRAEADAVRRALERPAFARALVEAMRAVVDRRPALRAVRF